VNFERRPDPRCQRGLRFDYLLEAPIAQSRLCEAVEPFFDGRMVRATENWATREVVRMVLQFRFEIRVGERDQQVSVLYRRCCPPAERENLRSRLEAALTLL
jgi:hypothetical protein